MLQFYVHRFATETDRRYLFVYFMSFLRSYKLWCYYDKLSVSEQLSVVRAAHSVRDSDNCMLKSISYMLVNYFIAKIKQSYSYNLPFFFFVFTGHWSVWFVHGV